MNVTELNMNAAEQRPDWLQLEPGEQYLGSYPAKQGAEAVVVVVIAVLLLCALIAVLGAVQGWAPKGGQVVSSVGGTLAGLIFSWAQLRKQRLYLTSKMLVFGQPPKKVQGLPLEQVSRLERGTGLTKWTVYIYGPQANKPATTLTVFNTDAVLAELSERCGRAREQGR